MPTSPSALPGWLEGIEATRVGDPATLFLDDARISTNVRLFGAEQDERAIGTRVSLRAREQVLDSGQTWLDRAFVVDDWHVSG